MSDLFTIWDTRYALTSGIKQRQAEDCGHGMVRVTGGTVADFLHTEGRDWHRTNEGAVARAEVMRHSKIASHRKSIAKLEKLSFA